MVSGVLFPHHPDNTFKVHEITTHKGSLQFMATFWEQCSFEGTIPKIIVYQEMNSVTP